METLPVSPADRKFLEASQVLADKVAARVVVSDESGSWVVSFGPGIHLPCYTEEAAECVAEDLRGVLRNFGVDLVETLQRKQLI